MLIIHVVDNRSCWQWRGCGECDRLRPHHRGEVWCLHVYCWCWLITDRVDSEEDVENVTALGLGELADLTVFNEADTSSYDVSILWSIPCTFPLLFTASCGVQRGHLSWEHAKPGNVIEFCSSRKMSTLVGSASPVWRIFLVIFLHFSCVCEHVGHKHETKMAEQISVLFWIWTGWAQGTIIRWGRDPPPSRMSRGGRHSLPILEYSEYRAWAKVIC